MNTDNRKQISKRKQFKTIFVFSYFILPYVKLPILKMMHLPITLTDVSVLVQPRKNGLFKIYNSFLVSTMCQIPGLVLIHLI